MIELSLINKYAIYGPKALIDSFHSVLEQEIYRIEYSDILCNHGSTADDSSSYSSDIRDNFLESDFFHERLKLPYGSFVYVQYETEVCREPDVLMYTLEKFPELTYLTRVTRSDNVSTYVDSCVPGAGIKLFISDLPSGIPISGCGPSWYVDEDLLIQLMSDKPLTFSLKLFGYQYRLTEQTYGW